MHRALAAWGVMLAAVHGGCGGVPPTQAVHVPARIRGARDVGPAPRGELFDVVVGIDRRPPPSWGEYEGLARWFEERGLTVTRRTESRTTMTLRGSVAMF